MVEIVPLESRHQPSPGAVWGDEGPTTLCAGRHLEGESGCGAAGRAQLSPWPAITQWRPADDDDVSFYWQDAHQSNFVSSSLRWLLGRDDLIGIASRLLPGYHLNPAPVHTAKILVLCLALLPAFVLSLLIALWSVRWSSTQLEAERFFCGHRPQQS